MYDAERLKDWLTEEFRRGIEVNNQFPCRYNEHGFGYEIVLRAPDKNRYSIILTRKKGEDLFVIREISKVMLHKPKNEEIKIMLNKKVILIPSEPKRYSNDPVTITITGMLRIEE